MDSTVALAPPSPIELEVRRLRRLQKEGRHAEALEGARSVLRETPENRDLLLIVAISLRYLLRIDEALDALDALAARHPRFSRLHEERGLCFVARKDASPVSR
jgi:tetratricopeptide (TPR) repeat protein